MSKALVLKSTGNWYRIKDLVDGREFDARLRGKFRTKNIKHTNPVSVGDWVDFDLNKDGVATIHSIKKRQNYLIRKSVNLSKETHIIASNIDQLFLMVTLSNPRTSLGFVDRVLVTAQAYHVPVKIVFNKIDGYSDEDLELLSSYRNIYEPIGYECFEISAKEGKNLINFKELLKEKVSLIAGHSGVGKTTLLNALIPDLKLKTSEVSNFNDKGKHTTTFAQMLSLPFGGYLIDTPGIKEFGLVDMQEDELQDYFPEIFERKQFCKFHNCLHKTEPKCAVIESIKNAEMAESRYLNYLQFLEEDTVKR